ncbi:M4 family metallopeptidase [Nocardioides ungokensis]|uniref:M4 family metallopeptidase n=1 Tax=Nocardioides ungokensis TaxID=1643322 RepID=UPI001FE9EDF7|nr:M4 family metallopeptidase [Nocardioides ungokensis]
MNKLVAGPPRQLILASAAALLSAVTVVSAPTAGMAAGGAPAHQGADARAQAASSARNLVADRPARLHASKYDAFRAMPVQSSSGLQYVPYERTYKGLPVIGGDFVVSTDSDGKVLGTTVAQTRAVQLASVSPTVSKAAARSTSAHQVKDARLEATRLVVLQRAASALAWETTVDGVRNGEASRLTVYVDAHNGHVLSSKEHVMEGTGTSAYAGTVTIPTSLSGSTYSMKNSNAATLVCQDAATNTTFTGADDLWGNGNATSRETGCVDSFYSAEQERQMLSAWDGRSGMDGAGGWVPIRVGLADVNAYYDGTQVQVGHTQTGGKWIGSIDVVAHEFGHGVDDHTPGGISGNGTQEFVADTFGAATEWYANNPTDRPDYTVGEQVNLVGNGPIRYMYNPSLAGDSNCYTSSTPTDEVHAAAGPGNHWFYLMAEGTSPTDGQPTSPTCNGSSITGIGIQKAEKIMYNAMLMKTSSSSYLKYRTWTLTAAKNLYGATSCTEFNAVKAAWDAVNVPAQAGDPTCSTGGGGGTCTSTGQKLGNPGFETGSAAPWSASSGVVDNSTGEAAHSGSWKAWMDGYGSSHTDTLSQSVTIPSGCKATLSFYLHIDTAESGSTAYDKLTVKAGSTTLATYSNANAASGYALKSFDVSSLAGQTVTISFSGVEDSSLQTSFVVDDTALTTS